MVVNGTCSIHFRTFPCPVCTSGVVILPPGPPPPDHIIPTPSDIASMAKRVQLEAEVARLKAKLELARRALEPDKVLDLYDTEGER